MPSRLPMPCLGPEEVKFFPDNEIESSRVLDQKQLDGAKIYSSREEYAKTLPQGMKWMEIGVAWGYYSEIVCDLANPRSTELVDLYDNVLQCWSDLKFGECKCDGMKHERLYDAETHEQYIIDKFTKYANVKTIKGTAPQILPNESDYDYVYIDTENERFHIREMMKKVSGMIKVGGLMGLNDYTYFDGVILDIPYGTYTSVNEFLWLNKNWSVDAMAMHQVGFNDIYLRRNA
jgi:hypothetical protein